VAQARSETFYRGYGVPDTVHGRFELTVLHVALVVTRLQAAGEEGQELARAMLEAFVADMDDACRRLGIGDMGVPRHVKKAAAAVLERGNAYRAAIVETPEREAGSEDDALAKVLAAEIWNGSPPDVMAPRALADYVRAVATSLAEQDNATLASGTVAFPEVPDRVRSGG
jgi:cytochrome b pre-mRNA-processing protein 3